MPERTSRGCFEAPDLLDKDFLRILYFVDLRHQKQHWERLSVRDKRVTYKVMRQAEHRPDRTSLFIPANMCTTGEVAVLQLSNL